MKRQAAVFNIEDNVRYVPTIARRAKKPRRAVRKEPLRPNPNKSVTPSCNAIHGQPCKCRRLAGPCVQCRREVVVSVGERADAIAHDRGRLIAYRCVRCRKAA